MNQENELITNRLSAWWKSIPIFNLILITLTSISSILTLPFIFETPITQNFTYSPYTMLKTQSYYTILTYPFICFGIPQAIILIYSYQSFSVPKEKSIGTFRFILYFFIQNTIIAIFFIPISIFAGENLIESTFINLYMAGLWPALMAEVIIDSYKDSNKEVNFLCFTCKIKNKYYPLILFVLFSFIAAAIFMLIAGVITGFICKRYLDAFGWMDWSHISDSCAEKVERKACCCLFKMKRFVSIAESEFEMQPAALPQSREPSPPFAGTGYRLGG